jgi:hypothetical protein
VKSSTIHHQPAGADPHFTFYRMEVDTNPQLPEVQHEPQTHGEPEIQRSQLDRIRLTKDNLERIREEVIRYFQAYYSELRNEMKKRDPAAVPEYLRGHRHIMFELGKDGAVITHLPSEKDEDTFDFRVVQDDWVRDIAAVKALKTPSGTVKSVPLDYDLGEDFGDSTYLGPLVHQEGDLYYDTNWVQMDFTSWVNLGRWQDENHARQEAREDLRYRLGGRE